MHPVLQTFDPSIQHWFSEQYPDPTDIQVLAWPEIAKGKHLLMTAPTGSGKTLTAFLWSINQFITGAFETGATRVLYISPLKALNNDIERNLITPLNQLKVRALAAGLEFPDIRVQTRSGDTPQEDRRRMLRSPPEILITTPESLNLLLTSQGGQSMLGDIQTVILDEIHGVVSNKRGVYLMSAIERLVPLSGEFQRLALSATVTPLPEVAKFVGGYEQTGGQFAPRQVACLASEDQKQLEVTVCYPKAAADRPTDEKVWNSLVPEFIRKIRQNNSTLIFVNSRALSEKLTHLINESAGELLAYAHHGSLSREIRTEVEHKLKQGELAAIVATNTLEMGIDIGHLDEVLLVQAPASISSAIQKIGRAGHSVGDISRCTIYPTHPLDYIEATVLAKAIRLRDIEAVKPVNCPLDVLAQIILSICATRSWDIDALFMHIRCAQPFNALTEKQFELVLNMLVGRYADNHIRELRPRVVIDRLANTISSRRGAVLSLYQSGGVIPDRGYFQLRHEGNNARIGELDEEFVWEANVGKVFSFGTQNWQVTRITHNDVVVAPANPSKIAPPFWKSEGISRDFHYASRVGEFLEEANDKLDNPDFRSELAIDYGANEVLIDELISLLAQQRRHTNSPLPHRHHLLVEYTRSAPGGVAGQQAILHTGWGACVNRPLAMALEAGWQRKWQAQPEIWVGDQCLVIQLPHRLDAAEIFDLVPPGQLEQLLRERLEGSGFFGARFRENAGRAMLLSKGRFNERKPLWMSRLQSQKLMDSVLKFEDFPILIETWRNCLQDEFDMPGLAQVLDEVATGVIRIGEVETGSPSPFARTAGWDQVNTYMYMTDQPKTGKSSRLSQGLLKELVFEPLVRPKLPASIVEAFIQRRQRTLAGYQPDTPEDVVEWVKERTFLASDEGEQLLRLSDVDWGDVQHLLIEWQFNQAILIVPRESLSNLQTGLTDVQQPFFSNWLQYYGPITTEQIEAKTGLDRTEVEAHLNLLVADGQAIQGELITDDPQTYWCDAENFESLLRFLRQSRQVSFKPLPIKSLTPYLFSWQCAANADNEEEQLIDCLESLAGLVARAPLWESDILPARIPGYSTHLLDQLFQAGNLLWVGQATEKVCFLTPADLDLIGSPVAAPTPDQLFEDPFARYDFGTLLDKTGSSPTELAARLWQDAWQGKLTNDSMMALRKGILTRFETTEAGEKTTDSRRGRRAGFRRWQSRMPFAGNWRQINYPEVSEDLLETEALKRERARLLLDRYGVVFRELLRYETECLQWREVFRSLRLMELAGEVHSGYFFEDVPGPQFISPSALRALHQQDSRASPAGRQIFWVNAMDPASVCGLPVPALKGTLPRRVMSNYLTYDGNELVLVTEKSGRQLDIRVAASNDRLPDYFDVLRHLLTRDFQPLNQIEIETINGESARNSPYLDALSTRFELHKDYKSIYLQTRR